MSANHAFMDERAKRRRFQVEGAVAMGAYTLILMPLGFLMQGDLPRAVAVGAVIAVMTPVVAFAVVYLRYLRRIDELQRKIKLEAIGLAFAGTAVVVLGYGFLMLWAAFPPMHPFAVWAVMGTLWLVGGAVASRRYR